MDGDLPVGTATPVMASAAPDPKDWRRLSIAVFHGTAGIYAVGPAVSHSVSLHMGAPIHVACRCENQSTNGLRQHGDTDLVPAGVDGVWIDGSPSTFMSLGLQHQLLRATAEEMELDPDRVALTPRLQLRDPQIQHIAWALRAELEAGEPGGRLYGESLATALSAHLVSRYAEPIPALKAPQRLSERQRRRVLDHIDAHLDEDLSLSRLAGVAGVSVSHFKPLFKRTIGCPPHQFVIQRRVQRARMLLTSGHASIAEAALEAGFTHQSHMARWMRRLLGVTPAALVRQDA